jgi:elongation factor G
VAIRLTGGRFEEGESTEMGFRNAAVNALWDAAKLAGPVLLEPVMSVEVVAPAEFLGDVTGHLVPLVEMFGYATQLRSLTQGRGVYTCSWLAMTRVPEKIAADLTRHYVRR